MTPHAKNPTERSSNFYHIMDTAHLGYHTITTARWNTNGIISHYQAFRGKESGMVSLVPPPGGGASGMVSNLRCRWSAYRMISYFLYLFELLHPLWCHFSVLHHGVSYLRWYSISGLIKRPHLVWHFISGLPEDASGNVLIYSLRWLTPSKKVPHMLHHWGYIICVCINVHDFVGVIVFLMIY